MTETPGLDLARSWLKYQDEETEEDKWAIFELQELVLDDRTRAVRAVGWLIDAATTPWHLTMIGAGPTEDLLHLYGPSVLLELEREGSDRNRFWQVLTNVRPNNPEAEAAIRQMLERLV